MSNRSIALPKVDVPMRIIGSILVIAAYFVVLHVNVYLGVTMNLIGDTLSMPYFIRTKSYDVVVMLTFLMVIGLSKLVSTLS
jgi:uncharacterized membrane protein YccC|tara:strand:+ start:588 stop:833 length:246 start_codon:yes stop_codon:yes gene_type:complete